jgi:hypothetical protein
VVRDRSVLGTPGGPAFLLFVVAFLPAPPFAVDRLLDLGDPIHVCLTPQPHCSVVPDRQLGSFDPPSRYPSVQSHHSDARCFGSSVGANLNHILDMYTIYAA